MIAAWQNCRYTHAMSDRLPVLYQMEEAFWWNQGMRAVTLALLAGVGLPDGPLIELGCGAGAFGRLLRQRGIAGADARPVLEFDLRRLALRYLRAAADEALPVQADLHDLPLAASSSAGVIALDVFDQQGINLTAALVESWRVLRPGGILLTRVSAYPWLQGPHDFSFGTHRRFTRCAWVNALTIAGFHLERVTHANSLLLAPAALARLAQRLGFLTPEAELNPPAALNRLLAWVLKSEGRWLRHHTFPAGLSLFTLARK